MRNLYNFVSFYPNHQEVIAKSENILQSLTAKHLFAFLGPIIASSFKKTAKRPATGRGRPLLLRAGNSGNAVKSNFSSRFLCANRFNRYFCAVKGHKIGFMPVQKP